MKTKELLIDFVNYMEKQTIYKLPLIGHGIVENYLKSINYSNEPNEFRDVGNNENTQEKCNCIYSMDDDGILRCIYCRNEQHFC